MDGLSFDPATPPARSDPARADIACFVGFVAPRLRGAMLRTQLDRALRDRGWSGDPLPVTPRILPDNVRAGAFPEWLTSLGWKRQPNAIAAEDLFASLAADLLGDAVVKWWADYAWLSPVGGRSAADVLELLDLPVPIDTWDAFDTLFAWSERPLPEGGFADSAMGAAVRRFFLSGGRKCYVVAVGDPWPLFTRLEERIRLRERLIKSDVVPSPVDRSSWQGVAHLFGIPDVSFLCTPDLPELCAVDVDQFAIETEAEGEERFIECAERVGPAKLRSLRAYPSARCDEPGYRDWAALVARMAALVRRDCREVQFVGAVPLPLDARALQAHPELLQMPASDRRRETRSRMFRSSAAQLDAIAAIQTAFVQLVYPWLKTPESGLLPGALEAPDAFVVGLLANNALTLGTWHSMARQPVTGVLSLEPTLSMSDLESDLAYHGETGGKRVPRAFRERVSIVAPSSTGFQLLSDVTTDDDEAYRPANVNRLISVIVRAARLLGEDSVFVNNGELLWRHLQSALEALLLDLWGDGALAGASATEAFDVRCDRSTMTQADLDAGRAVARVEFTAAAPVEHVSVVLAMDEGGQVTIAR